MFVREPHGVKAYKHSLSDLDTFLYPEDHEYVENRRAAQIAQFERWQTTVERPRSHKKREAASEAEAAEPKWVKKQKVLYDSAQVLPSTTTWQSWMLDECPEYAVMGDRTREMLDVKEIVLPRDVRKLVVRLDQSKPGVKEGLAPTITPGCLLWVAHRGRTLLAREKLALQGIYVSQATVDKFGERLVSNLAGNAFCSTSCLIAVVVALAGMGRRDFGGSLPFDPFAAEEISDCDAN